MKDFRSQVEAMREELIAQRRDFHQHPELAFEEIRTAGIVAEQLQQLGLEVQSGVGKTGVVGVLDGEHDGPTVLVRCDMDALPVTEENETDYVSQTPGKMHACGHDGHTTIALAVARLLNDKRADMHGRVKFVFQPAEETGLGARAMIADGVLDRPKPDYCVGLHLWNEMPVGQVAVPSGPSMAGAGMFELHIQGRGGHAAMPHQTADPVVALAQTINAMQAIVSRNVEPTETAVISITQLAGSHAPNIIPDSVSCAGTIRTFTPAIQQLVTERMHAVAQATAQSMGCTADLQFGVSAPPVNNNAEIAARLTDGYRRIVPDITIHNDFRTMAAEDVSLFLEAIPGVYMMVGSANHERGLDYPHHHPRFDIDEEALIIGASMLASAVSEFVLPD